MEPISIVALITTAIPFITTAAKKLFKTDQLEETKRKGVNALIPVLIGVLSSGAYAYSQGQDLVTALAIGLGSGGAASSARDIEKNLVQLVQSISMFMNKK